MALSPEQIRDRDRRRRAAGEQPAAEPAAAAPMASFRGAFATEPVLPNSGVGGDLALVLDLDGAPALMSWDGTGQQWRQVASGGGGGGGGGSLDIIEDPVNGWPARPPGGPARTWIGWSDPTDLMDEYDRFISIPQPS